MRITTSWDDGHPADRRLADLLARYGMPATFYVPTRNVEQRPVMTFSDVKVLAQDFEIGGHSRDHVVLPGLGESAIKAQVGDNKAQLEDIMSRKVQGYSYVRGIHDKVVRDVVKLSGFNYARTTKNFCSSVGPDLYRMPVTLQFFPHPASIYLRNLAHYGLTLPRTRLALAALFAGTLVERVRRMSDYCALNGDVFHLWGHSWELDEFDLWEDLEEALAYLARSFPKAQFVPNCATAGGEWLA